MQQNIRKSKERATMGQVGGCSKTEHTVPGKRIINPHVYAVLEYVRTFNTPVQRCHYNADVKMAQ